jgi:hypothetical protein
MHLKKGGFSLCMAEFERTSEASLLQSGGWCGLERGVDAQFVLERNSSCRMFPLLLSSFVLRRLWFTFRWFTNYDDGVLRLGN